MNKTELKLFLAKLNLPEDQYAVFGGASMTIRGLRNCGDLDLFITHELYVRLLKDGWHERSEKGRKPYLVNEINGIPVQAFEYWQGGKWIPNIAAYIAKPEIIDGIPFMPLKELYKWKKATARPKDLRDLEIIQAYYE